VNLNEAKTILVLHRPGTDDVMDPQLAEALALAGKHPELAGWLSAQRAQQQVLREKFRQITPPAGLKEQIISEQAASRRRLAMRRTAWCAVAAVLLLLGSLALVWFPSQSARKHSGPVPASDGPNRAGGLCDGHANE
jgi:ferric-dicitrate binding protein FerR (iron transport regulator)